MMGLHSPTRTCVEIELPPSVPFVISLLAFRPLQSSASKSFLHVESRSNWASCIVGPYRFKGFQTVLPNIPRVVRLTNVRFIPSQVIYSWRSFESQAALLKTRSSNSKCGTNLFYSGLIGLKSFEHLMGEFFLFSNPNFYLISYENKRVHQKNTTAQPYHHRRTGFYDFDALWTSHPDNRPRQ